ncbi:guanine nucleotide-binding protein subunit beta-like protein 1 [Arctopsyche grandis]|uniref:guanine nucleotide-binding protein subunit beta-like protein 1 n=1 Tax=Arctopsyche grandis TaxID=121162 RepID=UPI00406D7D46
MAVLPPDPVFSLRAAEMAPVHSICFHCNGDSQRLLAGTQDGKVFTWNLATKRYQNKINVGSGTILHVFHTTDTLFTQEKGECVKIWKLSESNYNVDQTIVSDYCGFCRCLVSESNNLLFVPKKDSQIDVYTLDGEEIMTLPVSKDSRVGEVMCFKHLEISNSQYLLAAYESGDVLMWDLKTQKSISSLKLREFPLTLDYDLILGRGIYGNSSESIQVFSISKSDMKISLKCEIIMKNAGVNVLKIRNDKKVFVSGGWDGRLRVYSWKSLRPLAVLTEHKAALQDVCYSDVPIALWNSPIMAASGLDSTITLWDIYN